jgi:aspartate/tyrosine/aromatic aminotransferase
VATLHNLSLLPDDPILGLAQVYRQDPRADKVDLGIGIYKDVAGESAVLASVKQAEAWVLKYEASKAYTSTSGAEGFGAAIAPLVLGAGHRDTRVIQAPGATGALRLIAEMAKRVGIARVAVGLPTWPLHQSQFIDAGVQVITYPHLTRDATFDLDGLLSALTQLQTGDLVLLQAACHNPTGVDPTASQWATLLDVVQERGLVPVFDLAYQGFGQGLEQDGAVVRMFAERLSSVWVATSCSKNFGLYRERTGALLFAGRDMRMSAVLESHALQLARGLWSMPPAHGAHVVTTILGSEELKGLWHQELTAMRQRIGTLRQALVDALRERAGTRFDGLAAQQGMFSYLACSPWSVSALREKHGIYMVGNGRINVSGLPENAVDRVAQALAATIASEEKVS